MTNVSSEHYDIDGSISATKVRILNAIQGEKYQIVSFDVFDTAVLRPFLNPHDLFRYMVPKVRDMSGLCRWSFTENRIAAERRVRDRVGMRDPNIDEIYQEIVKLTGIDAKISRDIRDLEVSLEVRFAETNKTIHDLYLYSIHRKKRIVFATDTYLDSSTIQAILTKTGYHEWEHIFVSSEMKATKKHGSMFPILCENLGVASNQILHIGDNRVSDISKAEENGLSCYHVVSPRNTAEKSDIQKLWGDFTRMDFITKTLITRTVNNFMSPLLMNKSNLFIQSHRMFGFIGLGIFLYSLVVWLAQHCHKLGIEKILFFARDGFLPYQAWERMGFSKSLGIKAEYVHISRKAMMPAYIMQNSVSDAMFSIPVKSGMTIAEFIEEILPVETASAILKKIRANGIPTSMELMPLKGVVESFLTDNYEFIRTAIQPQYKRIIAHFRKIIGGAEKVAVFDVGRMGSFQSMLSVICEQTLHGFYVITAESINENLTVCDYETYFPKDSGKIARAPDTRLYECLLSAPSPSLHAWNINGDPVFDALSPHQKKSWESLRRIHEGALDFVGEISDIFGDSLLRYDINSAVGNHILKEMWANNVTNRIFDDIYHDDPVSSQPQSLQAIFGSKKTTSRSISPVVAAGQISVAIYCPAMTRIRGGAERVAAHLGNYLQGKKFAVSMLTAGKEGVLPPPPVYPLPHEVPILHIDPHNVASIRKALLATKAKVLVVLASGDLNMAFVRARWGTDVGLLLSDRAEPYQSRDRYWKEENKGKYVSTYRMADLIGVQLESFKKIYGKRLAEKILVLPNPVFPIEPDPGIERRNVILCVARLDIDQKQQPKLIEAFSLVAKKYPNWNLELYGSAAGEMDYKALVELVASKGLSSRVLFMGQHENMHTIYLSASIFALPSRFEGFSNSLAEAMSAKLPAIGMQDCPGTNELIRNGINGFLANNVAEFADSLDRLMGDEKLRREMGEAAAESMQPFSPEVAMEKWRKAILDTYAKRNTLLSPAGTILRNAFLATRRCYNVMKSFCSQK